MSPAEVEAFVKAVFVKSRERTGLKHEVVARLMGMSASQLSMQLQPGGHLSLARLVYLAQDEDGKRLVQMFWHEVAEHLGIVDMDAVAAELKRFHGRLGVVVDKLQVRMAKSELRQIERERNIA